MLYKKSISPVVSIALLLVVTVVAVVNFQGWIVDFQSTVQSDVESQNSMFDKLEVADIVGNDLYLKSTSNDIITIFSIRDSSGNSMCSFSDGQVADFQGKTLFLSNFNANMQNISHVYDLSGYDRDLVKNGGVTCDDGYCSFNRDTEETLRASFNTIYIDKFTTNINFLLHETAMDGGYWHSIYLFGLNRLYQHSANNYIYNYKDGVGARYIINSKLQSHLDYNIISSINHLGTVPTSDDYEGFVVLNHNKYGFKQDGIFHNRFSNIHFGGSLTNNTISEFSLYSTDITEKEAMWLSEQNRSIMYEQILTDDIKEIDITSCNLTKGNKYNLFITTQKGNKVEHNFLY